MIQRIQTLFLIGALICLNILFLIPLGHIVTANDFLIDFYFNGISANEIIANDYTVMPLTILMGMTVGVTLITIFLYKRRLLQIRLCGINIFLIIGQIGMFLYYFFNAAKQIDAEKSFNISIILPIAAIIFLFLALRGVARDEAMVKAADRIR